jgi:hypothetical protein
MSEIKIDFEQLKPARDALKGAYQHLTQSGDDSISTLQRCAAVSDATGPLIDGGGETLQQNMTSFYSKLYEFYGQAASELQQVGSLTDQLIAGHTKTEQTNSSNGDRVGNGKAGVQ